MTISGLPRVASWHTDSLPARALQHHEKDSQHWSQLRASWPHRMPARSGNCTGGFFAARPVRRMDNQRRSQAGLGQPLQTTHIRGEAFAFGDAGYHARSPLLRVVLNGACGLWLDDDVGLASIAAPTGDFWRQTFDSGMVNLGTVRFGTAQSA
jgi:hypothetical protein